MTDASGSAFTAEEATGLLINLARRVSPPGNAAAFMSLLASALVVARTEEDLSDYWSIADELAEVSNLGTLMHCALEMVEAEKDEEEEDV